MTFGWMPVKSKNGMHIKKKQGRGKKERRKEEEKKE